MNACRKTNPAKYNSHKLQSYNLNIKHLLQFQESMETLTFKMLILLNLGKGPAIPVQAWTGPDGSRRLRLSDFLIIGT
jgi:hypothetical protein